MVQEARLNHKEHVLATRAGCGILLLYLQRPVIFSEVLRQSTELWHLVSLTGGAQWPHISLLTHLRDKQKKHHQLPPLQSTERVGMGCPTHWELLRACSWKPYNTVAPDCACPTAYQLWTLGNHSMPQFSHQPNGFSESNGRKSWVSVPTVPNCKTGFMDTRLMWSHRDLGSKRSHAQSLMLCISCQEILWGLCFVLYFSP